MQTEAFLKFYTAFSEYNTRIRAKPDASMQEQSSSKINAKSKVLENQQANRARESTDVSLKVSLP
jgi:hypothetical protein